MKAHSSALLLLTSVLLSACATRALNEGLPNLQGKKITYAIHYLGFPDSEQKIAGQKVYSWGFDNSGAMLQTAPQPFTATSYSQFGVTNYTGQTSGTVVQPYDFNCTVRLIADEKDIVTDWDWQGNEGGCEEFSSAMDKIIEANPKRK